MKKIKPDGSKTIYPSITLRASVGGIYEGLGRLDPTVDKTSGGSVTRTVTYYPVAGAMRINSTLYYILKDHLGSASVVTDASGNPSTLLRTSILGEQRYYPFGEKRLTSFCIESRQQVRVRPLLLLNLHFPRLIVQSQAAQGFIHACGRITAHTCRGSSAIRADIPR